MFDRSHANTCALMRIAETNDALASEYPWRLEPNRAIVTFYTYTAMAKDGAAEEEEKERIIRHTDTYRRGKYRALVVEKKIAEGPDALAF